MRTTRALTLFLSNPSPGTTLANSTVPITITDDDAPVLGFAMNAASVTEGGSISPTCSAIRSIGLRGERRLRDSARHGDRRHGLREYERHPPLGGRRLRQQDHFDRSYERHGRRERRDLHRDPHQFVRRSSGSNSIVTVTISDNDPPGGGGGGGTGGGATAAAGQRSAVPAGLATDRARPNPHRAGSVFDPSRGSGSSHSGSDQARNRVEISPTLMRGACANQRRSVIMKR